MRQRDDFLEIILDFLSFPPPVLHGGFVGLGASSNTNLESLAQKQLPGGGFCEQVLHQLQEQVQHSCTAADPSQLTAGQNGQTENN